MELKMSLDGFTHGVAASANTARQERTRPRGGGAKARTLEVLGRTECRRVRAPHPPDVRWGGERWRALIPRAPALGSVASPPFSARGSPRAARPIRRRPPAAGRWSRAA